MSRIELLASRRRVARALRYKQRIVAIASTVATVALVAAGIALTPLAAQAAGATGLTLSVLTDDHADNPAVGDSSDTNGLVPATGGAVRYQWGWADPHGSSATFVQTLKSGMTWDAASVAAGCTLTGSNRTLTCTIPLTDESSGTIEKTATVGNARNGADLSSTLISGAQVSAPAPLTAAAALPSALSITVASTTNAVATNGGVSGLQFNSIVYVNAAIDPAYGTKGLEVITGVTVAVTVPAGAVCTTCVAGTQNVTPDMSYGYSFYVSGASTAVISPSAGGGFGFFMPDTAFLPGDNVVQVTIAAGNGVTGSGRSVAYPATIGGLGTVAAGTPSTSSALVMNILPAQPLPGDAITWIASATPAAGLGVPAAANLSTCRMWDSTAIATLQQSVAGWTIEYGTMAVTKSNSDCGTVGDHAANWFTSYEDAAASPGGIAAINALRMRFDTPTTVAMATSLNFRALESGTAGGSRTAGTWTNMRNDNEPGAYAYRNAFRSVLLTAVRVRMTTAFGAISVNNAQSVGVTLQPTLNAGTATGRIASNVIVQATMPNGCFAFVAGAIAPVSVVPATASSSSSCLTDTAQVVTWNLGDLVAGSAITPVTFSVVTSIYTPNPAAPTLGATISSTSDAVGPSSANKSINTTKVSQLLLTATSTASTVLPGGSVPYTLNWKNGSVATISAYVVDVLPSLTDGRGTSGVTAVAISGVTTTPAGLGVEYTTDSTASIKAALALDLTGSTGISWSSTNPGFGAKALRIASPGLVTNATGSASYLVTVPTGFTSGGQLVNDATIGVVGGGGTLSGSVTTTAVPTVLQGVVYHDVDYSGVQDAADLPLSGVTVKLDGYEFGPDALDNSGGGDDVATHLTFVTVGGAYSFPSLKPGVYSATTTVSGKTVVLSPAASMTLVSGTTTTGNFLLQTTLATPNLSPDSAKVSQGLSVSIPVTANDTTLGEPAGYSRPSTFTATSPTFGSIGAAGAAITYTAPSVWPVGNTGSTYTDTFTYTVTNIQGTNSSATVTVTVYRTPSAVADDVSVPSSSTSSLDVLANDIGDSPTLTGVDVVGEGSVSIVGGKVRFVPAVHAWSGGESSYASTITYHATDSQNQAYDGTFTVTVVRPPLAAADSAIVSPSGSIDIDAIANDSVYGTPGTIAITSVSTGSASVVGNRIRFSALFLVNTTATINYTVTDSVGQVSASVVTVTVTKALAVGNDGSPTAITLPQGGSTTTDVLANDAGSSISITGTTTPGHGSVVVNVDDTITYTPLANYSGLDSYTYTITDLASATAIGTVFLDVVASPVANPEGPFMVGINTSRTLTVTGNDTGRGITVTGGTASHGTVSVASSSSITYTPAAGYVGADTVQYTITDAVGATAVGSVTFTVIAAPVANADGPTRLKAGGSVDLSVLANDTGTSISVTSIGPASHGTVTNLGAGILRYQVTGGYTGADHFDYTITDGAGATTTATVTVTVVAAPVASAGIASTTSVDQIDITLPFTADPSAVVMVTSSPAAGTATVVGTKVRFTPNGTQSGAVAFTYKVTDDLGQSDSSTVTITVFALPTTTSDVAEAGSAAITVDVLANDTSGLTLTGVSTAGSATVSTVAGGVRFTPGSHSWGAAELSYQELVTYTAKDVRNKSTSGNLTVTVYRPLDLKQDTYVTSFGTAADFDVLANDTVAAGPATVTVATAPTSGTVSIVGNKLHFVPDPGQSGTVQAEYGVTDRFGRTATQFASITVATAFTVGDIGPMNIALSGTSFNPLVNSSGTGLTVVSVSSARASMGPVNLTYTPTGVGPDSFTVSVADVTGTTKTLTVSLTVLAPPVANPDGTFPVGTNTSRTVTVTGNDTGTGISVIGGSANHGLVNIVSATSVQYVPSPGYVGSDTVTYTISDAVGVTRSSTVAFEVLATPVATADGPTRMKAGGFVDLGVLANDSGTSITITSIGTASHGTVTNLGAGVLRYTVTGGYTGADSFSYTITDGAGITATATASVTVIAKPVAGSGTASTTSVDRIDITLPFTADPSAVVTIGSQPAAGAATVVGSKLRFTPDGTQSGDVTVGYTVTDDLGQASSSTVTITVFALPTTTADAAEAGTAAVTIDVLANDTAGLTLTGVSTAGTGSVSTVAGAVKFTPGTHSWAPTDLTYSEVVTYTAKDVRNKTASGALTITVFRPSVLVDDSHATPFGTAFDFNVLANDTIAATPRVLSVTSQPALGTASVVGGLVHFAPATGQVGTVHVGYTVTDRFGRTAAAELAVTIADVFTVSDIGPLDVAMTGVTFDALLSATGTGLSVTAVSSPKATITGSNVTYLPSGLGPDTFTVTVSDVTGATKTVTVTLTVTAAPALAGDTATTDPSTAIVIDVLANDVVSSAPGSITAVTQPSSGSTAIVAGGIRFTPAAVGDVTFDYTVTDARSVSSTATVTVHVVSSTPPSVSIDLVYKDGTAPQDKGNSFTVKGWNLEPGGTYEVILHSTPIVLLSSPVDASRGFNQTYRLPSGIPAGVHTLILTYTGPTSASSTANVQFQVTRDGMLAPTGADPRPAVLLGSALLGGGAVLVGWLAWRRRRRA